jgi:sugar-phosphatase
MSSFSCEAVLFDLDGVLVDSTACVSRIWADWAREHGLDPDYVAHITHGQRTIETVRQVAPQLDARKETDRIEQQELNDTDGLRVLPGARELLTALPPDRYTIVTSGTRRLASKRLRAVGLAVPPQMVTADDVTHGKPNPEPYLAGAKLLKQDPRKCLVFEDAPSGIRAAQAAGMPVIALTTTYRREELPAAVAIAPSLAAVKARLQTSGELLVTVESSAQIECVER